MLQIIDIYKAEEASLEFDDYIPLRFRVPGQVLDSPYLWRTGNFDRTLLEVKINRWNASVYGVTLVSLSGQLVSINPWSNSAIESIEGVPVVDLTNFAGERFDERCEFRVSQLESTIIVMFDLLQVPDRRIYNGRTDFLACGKYLCGIAFNHLSTIELHSLNSWFQRELG